MRQRLGQHFLRDPVVIQTILAAAELKPTDTVLEIGPGKGVLTRELAKRVKRLQAVELDATLAAYLTREGFAVARGDILKTDLDTLFSEADRPIKVLGNLPYAITSPIFEKLLAWKGWETGVFLIQKEVAERITACAGSRAFGILSLAVQAFAEAEIIRHVPPGAFVPLPEVDSAVIRLRRRAAAVVMEEDTSAYFDLAHGAFAHRRKTVANSLALFTKIPRPAVEKWLHEQGVEASSRAEALAALEYARLAGPWSIFRRKMNLTA